jgi:uncharacterized protein YecA (UPF0149 family)
MNMMSDNGNDPNKTPTHEGAEQKPHVHGPNCNHGHGHHHHDLTPYVRSAPKVGPNEPCPCGSGKKHKKCCRT